MKNPTPVSRSAIPMTIEKTATRSAKKDVFSAVVRAVSVTPAQAPQGRS